MSQKILKFILLLLPIGAISNVLRNPNQSNFIVDSNSNRRISHDFNFEEWFIDGLYNKKGKRHDLGSDFGLTSDLYNLPNPYYTKLERKRKNTVDNDVDDYPRPVYIHPTVTTQSPLQSDNSISSHLSPSSSSSSSQTHSKSNAQKNSIYSAPSHTSYSYNPPSAPASSYSVQSVSSYSPSSYGSYGYPPSAYGPPQVMSGSYPPAMQTMQMMPESQKSHGEWFLTKIMKKFDLILMSKILLKLIIFKKIVKFIGIICLLMFLPILKKKFEEHVDSDEDEGRRIAVIDDYAKIDVRLREIFNFASTAIDGFQHDNIPWCVGESQFYCRLQYMLDEIDFRYPATKIMTVWLPELVTTTLAPLTTAEEHVSAESEELENDIPEDTTPIAKFNKIFKRE